MRRTISILLLMVMIMTLFPVMPVWAAAPAVTTVSPAVVPADGGQIMIYGTDLNDGDTRVILQMGAEIVSLDGAAITLATPSLLIVKVPPHAVDATGIKQVDNLVVSNNSGSSAPKPKPFQYMKTPEITHSYPFTTVEKYDDAGNPSQNEADKKTYLKIEGGYFDWVDKVYLKEKDTPDGSALKFGNFADAAGPLNKDKTEGGIYIEVTDILRGKEVQIKVENVGGYSSPWFDSPYYNVPGPYITTFYPNPNPIFVGTNLDLSGANFLNDDPTNTRVYIGGVEAEKVTVQSTSVRVKVPNPQPGNRDLKIEVWDKGVRQGVAIYKNALTIKVVPTGIVVDQVLPNHGPVNGGNRVIVVGERFDQTMTVAFEIGGHTTVATNCETVEPPEYLPAGKTAFEVIVPPSYQGRQGAAIVKIVDSSQTDLIYDQQPNLYFYSTHGQYLDLQSVSPNSIPFDQPTPIQLQGQYFSYFRWSDSNKYLELSDGTEVSIGDPNNIELADLEAAGVNQLKLIEEKPGYYHGQDFRIVRVIQVTTGGVAAAITALNTVGNIQYITAESGFYPLGDKASEKVNVEVNINENTFYKDGGEWKRCIDETYYPLQEVDSLPGALTVTRVYPEPEIIAITPDWGPNLRSQEVLIKGYNFYEGVKVTFDGRNAAILSTERGGFTPGKGTLITLRVAVPTTSERGEVDVVIQNTDDKSAAGKYTYVSSPVISAVSPGIAPLTGGNHVTVTGSQFMFGSGVVIGDKVVCSEETRAAMESLIENSSFKEVVFGSDLPLTLIVDPDYRVAGADGSKLESYDNRPEGTRITLKVPPGVTAGKKDVYVINVDKGWSSLPEGFQYRPVTGTPANITVQPNQGDVEGGEEIAITVTNSSFLSQIYNPATGYGVIVTIDGAIAPIKQITDSNHKLIVTTPPGARVEEWTPVEVMNVSPEGIRLDILPEGFMYHRVLTLPRITDFFPKHGQKGTMVTVFGEYFSIDPHTQIIFGDQVLTQVDHQMKVINSGMITFPVPANDATGNPLPPGLYEIKVRNPDTGMATAAARFELQLPSSRPRIEDIDGDNIAIRPDKGSVNGGVDILVEGYDFHQGLELYIGGRPAADVQVEFLEYDPDFGVWSRCRIRAKTPPLSAGVSPGAADVMVVNPDGGTATARQAFTYVIPSSKPVIHSIQPNQGSSTGGLEVVISGNDFRVDRDQDNKIIAWPTVTFGGHQAFVIKDDTITRSQGRQVRVITPAYPGGGKVNVTLTNPDTGTYTMSGAFTYVASQPKITKVVPDKFSRHHSSWGLVIGTQFVKERSEPDPNNPANSVVIPGTDVLLGNPGGTFFTSLAGQTTMDGAVYENIQVLSDTQIRVIIPPAERTGTRILRIKNPDGGQADYTIEYVSPVAEPVIAGIDPAQGSSKGRTNVTITGSNFADRLEVYFGGQAAPVIEKSSTRIVVRTPAVILAADEDQRKVDVTVINTTDYGSAVKLDGFTYLRVESEPLITGVSPDRGTTLGGTEVVIKGENFRSGCKVFFGTTEAVAVTYDGPTQLTVITPPHDKGSVDVSVRNPAPDHAEAILPEGFTFEETIAPVPADFNGRIWNKRAIKLYWTASTVPSQYEIYVGNSSNLESSEYLGTTGGTEYMFEDIEANRYYYFWLRTINQDGTSKFTACKDNPIYVSSSDITNRPPTATVDTINTRIELADGRLQIIVGEDLAFWRYATYEILLDATQRKASEIELLIPSEGIDKNSVTTIQVVSNNFRIDLPLRALRTVEYQEFRRNNAEFYVKWLLIPAPPSYLESLALNLHGYQAVDGFTVLASIQSPVRETGMSLFASDVNVAWFQGRSPLTPLRAYGYDSFSRKWTDVTAFVNTASGQVTARVGRPDSYIICR
jgi:hypothetical protein